MVEVLSSVVLAAGKLCVVEVLSSVVLAAGKLCVNVEVLFSVAVYTTAGSCFG